MASRSHQWKVFSTGSLTTAAGRPNATAPGSPTRRSDSWVDELPQSVETVSPYDTLVGRTYHHANRDVLGRRWPAADPFEQVTGQEGGPVNTPALAFRLSGSLPERPRAGL